VSTFTGMRTEATGLHINKVKSNLVKARKEGVPLLVKRKQYPRLTANQMKARDKKIVRLYESGVSSADIAERFDLTRVRIYQITAWERTTFHNGESALIVLK
jgi:uncharacterized protein (DUF433 family)